MQIGVIPVTAFQQNCSVLQCEKTGRGAVVDPGGDLELVLRHIEEEGVQIEKILLTHAHIDHAGATKALRDRLKVPVIGPEREDEFLIQMLAVQGRMFGLGAAEPFVPDQWLRHGDLVSVGEESFEVRHCPGHTPGHVIFYNAAHKFALVGDVLFDGSIGRTDLPRGDHATLLASIKQQLLTLPDDTTFLPGHGPTSTIGQQRRSNPFLRDL
jgi:glyoxylase-like metal-dependent hydrolase (beta-lactamase superfamily II)